MDEPRVRPAQPADYDWIIRVVDDWWARPISASLPRLFLDHFHTTSFVTDMVDAPIAFLIGFISPSQSHVGYIHFVGVHPDHRRGGTARDLYERFTAIATRAGCTEIRAITGAVNQRSIDVHRRMGFVASDPIDGYNGPGSSLVTFSRRVSPAT